MITFTIDDIRRHVSSATFERGRVYQRQGRVRITTIEDDGGTIEGEVRGSERMPYLVSVTVRRLGNGSLVFGGDCSCPMGSHCKHVAALLLQVLGRQIAGIPKAPATSPSAEVTAWLTRLERVATPESEDYPPDIRQRLFYLLDIAPDRQNAPRPILTAASVRLLNSGEFSDKVAILVASVVVGASLPAKYLRPSDHALLRNMARLHTSRDGKGVMLADKVGAEVLAQAVATGRCRWGSVGGPTLAVGEPRPGTISWSLAADGRQRPSVAMVDGSTALPMVPPWYVDSGAGVCGPVDLGLSPSMATALLSAPPLAAADIALVRDRLRSSLPEANLALPSAPKPTRRIKGAPTRKLSLFWHSRAAAPNPVGLPLARLTFLYNGLCVESGDDRAVTPVVEDNSIVEIVRDRKAEAQARDRLKDIGFIPAFLRLHWPLTEDCRSDRTLSKGDDPEDDEDAWLDFLADEVPALRRDGWQIEVADDFPYQIVRPDGDPEARLSEGNRIDWFDLHLGVQIDGERVDILPALLRVLRDVPAEGLDEFLDDDSEDESTLRLRLEDGRVLALPFARLRPILKALTALYGAGWPDGRPSFSHRDAAQLSELVEATAAHGVVWTGGEKLRDLGRRLRDAAGLPPVALPTLFSGTLRPYQHTGLAWMQLLREVGLGGILADDMGLGKTVQTLAHLAVEKAEGRMDRPSLIVCPTSVLPNWLAEVAAFTPGLAVLALHGAARKDSFAAIAEADLVLTTYPLLARDEAALAAQQWHMVIIDEAQMVKNPKTAAALVLRRLDARHRLALTGTPLENHLGELWALFDFVSPGFLGDFKGFAKSWRTPIEKKGDTVRQEALARRVRPFLLRRTKAMVATDLPPKTEIIEHIELPGAQRDLYEGIRLAMHKKVRDAVAAKGLKRSHIELLDALLKLRQACCDPRLVKTTGKTARSAPSAKLARLMEMLPELIEEGRRILLFSQFTSMLALIEAELERAAIPYLLLTGDTTDRATPVRRFQAGEVPLFLISLKAGGSGLNLTAADTVIHYDPWWNPAVEAQATDRAHRIGQDKPVFVHKLVALDTIEVKMAALKARKQTLADGLFEGRSGAGLDIGEDDIDFLLGDEPVNPSSD